LEKDFIKIMARYKKLKIVCDACCHKPNAHLGKIGKGKSAGGCFFMDENDTEIERHGFYFGELTPPQAEYNALIKAMDKACGLCREEIEVWMDSELVIKQLNGDYGIKSENMKPLYDNVKKLESRFKNISYYHHDRNTQLAKIADKIAEDEYKKHQS
jgi:ribonuclease HI